MTGTDPYVELGISTDATPEEIRAAFRSAVRQRHPDTSPTPTDDAAVRNVIDAYRLLINPTTRAHHDAAHPPQRTADSGGGRVRVRPTSSASRTGPTKMVPCFACGGTGAVRSITTCPTCQGRAEITSLETTPARILRCHTCRGRGRMRSRRPCEACDGTGTVAPHT